MTWLPGTRLNDDTPVDESWPQDCDCMTHTGPHFIHMDTIDKAANSKYRDMGQMRAYGSVELSRLSRKHDGMVGYRAWYNRHYQMDEG